MCLLQWGLHVLMCIVVLCVILIFPKHFVCVIHPMVISSPTYLKVNSSMGHMFANVMAVL